MNLPPSPPLPPPPLPPPSPLPPNLMSAASGSAHLRARVVNKNQTDRPGKGLTHFSCLYNACHHEFLRLYLQAHRETAAHFTSAIGSTRWYNRDWRAG